MTTETRAAADECTCGHGWHLHSSAGCMAMRGRERCGCRMVQAPLTQYKQPAAADLLVRAQRWLDDFGYLYGGHTYLDLIRELVAQVQQLQQEKADFHLAYRTDCDRISKAALIRAEAADTHREALTRQLRECVIAIDDLPPHVFTGEHGRFVRLEALHPIRDMLAKLAADTGRT